MTRITALLLTVLLPACATTQYDKVAVERAIQAEFNSLNEWVQQNTNFDPYSNEVHINEAELRHRYNLMNSNIKDKLRALGIVTHKFSDKPCKTAQDNWHCYEMAGEINKNGVGEKWRSDALQDAFTRGYTLTQKGYPDGNVNFGSYTVPVFFLTGVNWGVFGEWHDKINAFNFSIKKNVATQQSVQMPIADPAAAVPTLDLEQKLKKLQSLKDQGLISEADYAKKKAELLSEF